ncbi:non-heme iron oxygenase ferredoxin subunit [Nigerium massiliense]|uniref:non-heme iron oxygenase ferredoxin subunit n=1 Tax=Nigerium massiliense TaxID=1522317 RepID=UPI0005902B07|nr:non-heme iron oxygenase ferredoxin subunit [Nigerium massiliense]
MSFVRACAVDELTDETPFSVDVSGTLVAIVPSEGELFAIRDECSHARIMLSEGEVEECTIECFAHGSRFDLRTGEPLDLPATQPVPVYPVTIEGGDVLVDIDNPLAIQES